MRLKGFFVFIFRNIGIFQSQKIKIGLKRIQFKILNQLLKLKNYEHSKIRNKRITRRTRRY